MVVAEVRQRRAVDHGALRRAQLAFQDGGGIGSGDGAHGVETQSEAGGEEGADTVEIDEIAHHRDIVGDGVDDLHHHAGEGRRVPSVSIDGGGLLDDGVGGDGLGRLEDGVGDRLGGGAAVRDVELQAEVLVGAAGIVRGGEHEAAEGLADADQVGGRRRRQDAATADDRALRPVGGEHAQDHGDRGVVVEAAVAADDDLAILHAADALDDRLDVVLEIARLHEDPRLLAQVPRCPASDRRSDGWGRSRRP